MSCSQLIVVIFSKTSQWPINKLVSTIIVCYYYEIFLMDALLLVTNPQGVVDELIIGVCCVIHPLLPGVAIRGRL